MNKKKLAILLAIAYPINMYLIMLATKGYKDSPNFITSIIFPVNESIWQHNKLFLLPCIFVFFVIHLVTKSKYKNLIPVAALTSVAMSIMPSILYPLLQRTCNITSENEMFFSIGLSCVILLIGYLGVYLYTMSNKDYTKCSKAAIIAVVFIFILFAVTTYYPPHLKLWYDTMHNTYGMVHH